MTDINRKPAGKQRKNEGVKTTLDTAGVTNKASSLETFDNPELTFPIFSYRIQISACRDQLSPEKLYRIYSGNEKIVETYEDDWYKYIIGVLQTYQEARILRDKMNVKGAFIVSYFNGKRIRITPSLINR